MGGRRLSGEVPNALNECSTETYVSVQLRFLRKYPLVRPSVCLPACQQFETVYRFLVI